jgi:hypothetical protein
LPIDKILIRLERYRERFFAVEWVVVYPGGVEKNSEVTNCGIQIADCGFFNNRKKRVEFKDKVLKVGLIGWFWRVWACSTRSIRLICSIG